MKSHALERTLLAALFLAATAPSSAATTNRITNLYDAFGAPSSALVKDWGFAALVEYGGKRILFDTGNHADTFRRNVEALGIDLKRLERVEPSEDRAGGAGTLHERARVRCASGALWRALR